MHGTNNLIEQNTVKKLVKFFANYVKRKVLKIVYGNVGYVNIKIYAFQDHQNSKEYKILSWATQQSEKIMDKHIRAANKCCDEALLALFRAVCFWKGRQSLSRNIHLYVNFSCK